MYTYYHLPQELITEILSRLPVKSLIRFKSVSKSWCHLIQTREFTDQHLQQSKETNSGGIITLFTNTNTCTLNFHPNPNLNNHPLPAPVKLHSPPFIDYYSSRWNELEPPVLVGSCNGLVCFATPFRNYVMYNPSTRAFKELPKVKRTSIYGFRAYSFLAYDGVNDDYKIFELFQCYKDYRQDSVIRVESSIYSMKANSWNLIDTNVPYNKSCFIVKNNSLCWIDREIMRIRSFDFLSERYDENDVSRVSVSVSVSLPKGHRTGYLEDFEILTVDLVGVDQLALWATYNWAVLPICRTKEGGFDGPEEAVGGWFDIKNGAVAVDRFPGLSNSKWNTLISAKPWVESLVSLG